MALRLAALAVIAGAVVLLTPLGGRVRYLVPYGASMEPTYRSGDLVFIRQQERYEVGDVIAYRNADLGRVVLHRIIDEADGAFTVQGDNNEWVDSTHPTAADVLGASWVRVPHAGRVLLALGRPPVAAALVAVAVLGMSGAFSIRTEQSDDEVDTPVAEVPA